MLRAIAAALLIWLIPQASGAASIEDVAMMKSGDRQKVLVEGAKMPPEEGLPESLRALTRRNAIVLTAERYAAELDDFVDAIQRGVIQDHVSLQASAPVLVRSDRAGVPTRLVVNSEMTIGSEDDADIRLSDPEVAAHHARVWPVLEGLMIEDLASGPGTWVDGKRVDRPQLIDHDAMLTLGSATLHVVMHSGHRRGEELAAAP